MTSSVRLTNWRIIIKDILLLDAYMQTNGNAYDICGNRRISCIQPLMLWMRTWVNVFFYALTTLSFDGVEIMEKLGIGTQIQWMTLHTSFHQRSNQNFKWIGTSIATTIQNQINDFNSNGTWYNTLQNMV